MGNGESTAMRISMQKTDEGHVQVSEQVLSRLKKGKGLPVDEPRDEVVIKEENLRHLLNDAYKKGREAGEKIAAREIESRTEKLERNEKDKVSRLKDIEDSVNLRNIEIGKLNTKIDELEIEAQAKLLEKQALVDLTKERLSVERKDRDALQEKIMDITAKFEEQSKLASLTQERLREEQSVKEECLKRLESRDESMKSEFNRGVEDIKKVLGPLQRDVLCRELQNDVLECYRNNKHHPLRCSNIVKEFRQCVQDARRRQMES
ncbi:MICOS complex subunit MIC19-like [Rhopilema esculentum]|uniref:MICOS complex subunit MIC19-like n=1 Tax=Rhopilema esculentum TaxID=499914 RepID=UPI0031E46B09